MLTSAHMPRLRLSLPLPVRVSVSVLAIMLLQFRRAFRRIATDGILTNDHLPQQPSLIPGGLRLYQAMMAPLTQDLSILTLSEMASA